MRTPTKLMGLGLAATGLLLTACEIPGGPPPLPVSIVVENPFADGPTEIPSLPAILKGTLIQAQQQEQVTAATLFGTFDEYTVTLTEDTEVQVHCELGDDDMGVGFSGPDSFDVFPCGPQQEIEGPFTLAAGTWTITVYTESQDAGLTLYAVHIDVLGTTPTTITDGA